MGVFIPHRDSCITYHHLRFYAKAKEAGGAEREVGIKGGKGMREKCISSSQDFI